MAPKVELAVNLDRVIFIDLPFRPSAEDDGRMTIVCSRGDVLYLVHDDVEVTPIVLRTQTTIELKPEQDPY